MKKRASEKQEKENQAVVGLQNFPAIINSLTMTTEKYTENMQRWETPVPSSQN